MPQTKTITIGGRPVTVPIDITPDQIRALAAQMRAPAEPAAADPTRTVPPDPTGTRIIEVNGQRHEIPASATPAQEEAIVNQIAVESRGSSPWRFASELMTNAGLTPSGLMSGAAAILRHDPFSGAGLVSAYREGRGLAQDPKATIAASPLAPVLRLGNVPQAIREGRYTDAANEAAASVPIVGPFAEHEAQLIKQGDYAGALGAPVGAIAPLFLPELAESRVGAAVADAVPKVVMKVVRAPGAVVEAARAPSTKVAARSAKLATQDLAEAGNRARYDAATRATREADALAAARAQAVYDAKLRAQQTGLAGTDAGAEAGASAAEAELSAARQVYDAKRAVHETNQDAIQQAAQDRHAASQAAHDNALAVREQAARALYDADRVVHEAKTAAAHDTALAQYAAKKAVYDQAGEIEAQTARAEYDARRAAAEGTDANRADAARQQYEARLAAQGQTQAGLEDWAGARQAAADAQQAPVIDAVRERLSLMDPTNIVTDRLKAPPEGAPAGTPGTIETTQFQLPSLETRTAQDYAKRLQLIRQTGGELPVVGRPPAVPDLPLRPQPAIPGFVSPAARAFPEYVPAARAPFPDFVPPRVDPFAEYVPNPQPSFAEFVPPPRKEFGPFVPPSITSRSSMAARPMAEFVPPDPTVIKDYVPLDREVLPPATGPQTRGGELALKYGLPAGGLAGVGLLGHRALANLWDSFFPQSP
jgi:hypothetical protein